VNFLAGDTTKQVTVNVTGDTVFENNETFLVNLSNAINATIGDNQGVGTITNDDAAPTFAINDVTVTEGNSGTTTATFTVTKTGATEVASSVQVATADGTATVANNDYVALALTTLSFATGDTTKTVSVTVNGDTAVEPNETFSVNLTNAINATIADNQGVGTITNDDQPTGNTAPVAANDTATTQLHTPVVIDVLANDTDAQGNATIVPATVAVGTQPGNGTVSVNATTGKITYTPGIGFFGTDSFTYTVKDNGGLTSNIATVTVNVEHDTSKPVAQLLADPNDPNKTVLVVLGTDRNDKIEFVLAENRNDDHHGDDHHDDDHHDGRSDDDRHEWRWDDDRHEWAKDNSGDDWRWGDGRDDGRRNDDCGEHAAGIRVIVNGKSLGVFNPTSRIIAFGLNGNDSIKVDDDIKLAVELHGDAGNDRLFAGSGPAVLLGGAGNDLLIGSKERNILIGGTGADRLFGGPNGDIMIGGRTVFDRDSIALGKIMAEWNRKDLSFNQRVDHLTNGGGLNDGFRLTSSTVLDDSTRDRFFRNGGKDWLFLNSLDKAVGDDDCDRRDD
jgi:hypothetical protein